MKEYKEFVGNNNINEMLKNNIDSLKMLIDTNTIIGEPIKSENSLIIPISKVQLGFIVGGGEYSDKSPKRNIINYPMAGGSGGGMSVSPIGFLVDDGKECKYINVEDKSMYQTILNLTNKIINKIGEKNEKDTDS